jgi:hypothetical protein
MGSRKKRDDEELMEELEKMAAAAEMEDEDDIPVEDPEWPDAVEVDEGPAVPSPMGNRKVWTVIILIFVAIAVAVLYVYQAGDSKTILGNQPIPAGQAVAGGGAVTAAINLAPSAAPQRAPAALGGDVPQLAAQCPVCGDLGLPMCSKCNTVMQPLDTAPGLFVCPSCGAAGLPICPRCGGHMASRVGAGWR